MRANSNSEYAALWFVCAVTCWAEHSYSVPAESAFRYRDGHTLLYTTIMRYVYNKETKTVVPVSLYKARRDPDEVIREYGVGVLEKTREGRVVLENARSKYAKELLQPGDPSFNTYWGKDVAKRERDMAELRRESRRLKGDRP